MIIDNVDSLKAWLINTLDPICDADPSALAKYVIALVKKDKPDRELKALCVDQLDVFLQNDTSSFVDRLFEVLNSKSYLPQAPCAQPDVPKIEVAPTRVEKDDKKDEQQQQQQQQQQLVLPQSQEDDRDGRRVGGVHRKSHSPKQLLGTGPRDNRIREDKRRDERSRRRDYDRFSRDSRDPREVRDGRDREPRDERDCRDRDPRDPRESRDGREHRDGRSREYRERYERERRRVRSRTHSRSRSRSWERERVRDGNREPGKDAVRGLGRETVREACRDVGREPGRDIGHEPGREMVREPGGGREIGRDIGREPGREQHSRPNQEHERDKAKYDAERSDVVVDGYAPGLLPTTSASAFSSGLPPRTEPRPPFHGPSLLSGPPLPFKGSIPPGVVPSRMVHPSGPPPPKVRCRDYDEKGFCMRGDMCPFDHGTDPLVVDDVNLPSMIPFPPPAGPLLERAPQPAPPGMPPPPLIPPHSLLGPMPPLRHPSLIPPPGMTPTSGPTQHPSSRVETPSSVENSMASRIPPAIHIPPPPLPQPSNYSLDHFEADGYNPESPSLTATTRPPYRHFSARSQNLRPNLIGLTSNEPDPAPPRSSIVDAPREAPSAPGMRIVLDPEARKRTAGGPEGPPPKKHWFDNNRQGYDGQAKLPYFRKIHGDTKLEIRRVPTELNTISKLNDHFSKFGTIVNIQVAFGGDREGALIQFTSHEEARKAIASTEAVLNNRFIRVFWHRENNGSAIHGMYNKSFLALPSHFSGKPSVKERLGPIAPPEVSSAPSLAVVHNDFGGSASQIPAQVVSTTAGVTKTVYNPAAFKIIQKPPLKIVEAKEVLKKKPLQQDVWKKKQAFLEKQIETQKMLISKLEKAKPEERLELRKTLKVVAENIVKLGDEQKSSPTTPTFPVVPATLRARTRSETQRELLDMELDIHNKAQAGEDTTDLRKRLHRLQLEAAQLGIIGPGRGRGGLLAERGRVRGRGRGFRGRGRMTLGHTALDHRPKALQVSGMAPGEQEELLQHFKLFCEVEEMSCDEGSPFIVVAFRTRQDAEHAALQGARFKGRLLHLSWYKPKAMATTREAEDDELDEEEEPDVSDNVLLPDDDDEEEEEEEDESRSWRR
uniref:RNA-binding protein 26-like isoform X2 n=1 Tax=Myxine glutinosa TaxID=7769 RepID=UPI00358FFD55